MIPEVYCAPESGCGLFSFICVLERCRYVWCCVWADQLETAQAIQAQ